MVIASLTLTINFLPLQVERCQRPLFTQLQPFLLTIATSYPVEELSALANDLNVCIATLGAVWKSEMKEKVAASYSGPKKTLAEKKNKHADSNKVRMLSDSVFIGVKVRFKYAYRWDKNSS